jgi:hypothetical protein
MSSQDYCPSADKITTAEDCEAYSSELSLTGYTYSGEDDMVNRVGGCRWATYESRIYFNSNLDGAHDSSLDEGPICRYIGSVFANTENARQNFLITLGAEN